MEVLISWLSLDTLGGEVGCFPVHMTNQKNRKCTSLPLYEDASDSKYSLTFSTYQPGFWEMMKFAWMQYISILLIFLWIFERIKIFLLRNQVLNIVPVSLLPPLLSYKEHQSWQSLQRRKNFALSGLYCFCIWKMRFSTRWVHTLFCKVYCEFSV